MNDLFKEVMVWRRIDTVSAVRYSCLQDVENEKYVVQSADFFRLPLPPGVANVFAGQFAELFIDTSPRERCIWFNSLADAIAHHEREFHRHASAQGPMPDIDADV